MATLASVAFEELFYFRAISASVAFEAFCFHSLEVPRRAGHSTSEGLRTDSRGVFDHDKESLRLE